MDMLILKGFEEAEIGVCTTWHGDQLVERVVYNANKMVQLLYEKEAMLPEAAVAYIEAEFIFKYAGDTQPILVWVNAPESDEDQ